jgi:hypothetical protein
MEKNSAPDQIKATARKKKRIVIFETDDLLVARLDAAARATMVSRSWLIRAVLGGWLNDKNLGIGP